MIELRRVCSMGRFQYWELHGDAQGKLVTEFPVPGAPNAVWMSLAEGIVSLGSKAKSSFFDRVVHEVGEWAKLFGIGEIRIEGSAKRLRQWSRILTGFVLINDRGTEVLVKGLN